MGSYSDYMDFGRWDELHEKMVEERLNETMESLGYGNWPYLRSNEKSPNVKAKPIKKKILKKKRRIK